MLCVQEACPAKYNKKSGYIGGVENWKTLQTARADGLLSIAASHNNITALFRS